MLFFVSPNPMPTVHPEGTVKIRLGDQIGGITATASEGGRWSPTGRQHPVKTHGAEAPCEETP